jgi:hypothetical protein
MLEAFHIWQVSFLRKMQVLLLDFELQNRMLLFELSYVLVSISCLEGSPSVKYFFRSPYANIFQINSFI